MTILLNSNTRKPASILLLLLAAAIGGVVGGIIYFAVSQLFYLVLLSPIAIGLYCIAVCIIGLRKARLSNKVLAVIFGLLLGSILYTTFHYAEYLRTKREVVQFYQETFNLDPREGGISFDNFLKEETGSSGLSGYLVFVSREGFSFTGYFAYEQIVLFEAEDITFQGALAWLYWIIEFAIIVGFCIGGGLITVSEPFIDAGIDQYQTREQIGNINIGELNEFLRNLTNHQIEEVLNIIDFGELLDHPTIEIYIQEPKKDSHGKGLLTVVRTSIDTKGRIQRENTFWQEINLESMERMHRRIRENML